MTATWITTSATNVEAMMNSINAACDRGFIPDTFHFMKNPEVKEAVTRAVDHRWGLRRGRTRVQAHVGRR